MLKGTTPTKAESERMDRIVQIGCIVCLMQFGIYSPAEPHHLDGKTKPGAHLKTIPLCFPHHRGGYNDARCVSRHTNKTEFEKRYGKEAVLLEQTNNRIGEDHAA